MYINDCLEQGTGQKWTCINEPSVNARCFCFSDGMSRVFQGVFSDSVMNGNEIGSFIQTNQNPIVRLQNQTNQCYSSANSKFFCVTESGEPEVTYCGCVINDQPNKDAITYFRSRGIWSPFLFSNKPEAVYFKLIPLSVKLCFLLVILWLIFLFYVIFCYIRRRSKKYRSKNGYSSSRTIF